MTAEELLKIMAERGASLTGDANGLRLRGPKEAFTPKLVKVLKLHYGKLKAHFGAPDDGKGPDMSKWPWSVLVLPEVPSVPKVPFWPDWVQELRNARLAQICKGDQGWQRHQ